MGLISLGNILAIYMCTVSLFLKINSQLVSPISANGTSAQLPLTYYFNVTLNQSRISISFTYKNSADVDWSVKYASNGSTACSSTSTNPYSEISNCYLNKSAYKLLIYFYSSGGNCGNWVLVVNQIDNCGLTNCHYCPSGTACSICNLGYCIIGTSCVPCSNSSVAVNYYCVECASLLSNCTFCSDQNTCTLCQSTQFALVNSKCVQCYLLLQNCSNCSDQNTCTQCDSQEYTMVNSNCILCSSLMKGCTFCSDKNTCTQCQSQEYTIINSNCFSCSSLLKGCSFCSDKSTCTQCQSQEYTIANSNCIQCSSVMKGCTFCSDKNTCTQCQSQEYTMINSNCIQCSSLINGCSLCSDQNTCTKCINSYQIDSNHKCACANGTWQVTNLCISIIGCISASLVNGQNICKFCDMSQHFLLSQINNNCTCQIGYYFENATQLCEQYCGDGIIFNDECDDNNTENNDGCSSNCAIQLGFVCNYKINKSVCFYKYDLFFEFVNIYKVVGKNQAQIYLKINSTNNIVVQDLYKSSFNPLIETNLTTFLNVTGSQMEPDNVLVINVEYNKTLQLNHMQLIMNFNNTSFISASQNLQIYCKGKNFPLIISVYYEKYEQINKFSYVFGIVAYIVGLVLIISHKLIGVQTITTIQLVFFSQLIIYRSQDWPLAFTTLSPLKFSTGYNQFMKNPIFNSQNQQFLKFRYLSFQPNFIQNNLSNCSILIIITIIFFIVLQIQNSRIANYSILKQKGKNKTEKKKQLFNILKAVKHIYKTLFHFCMVILLQVLASLVIQSLGLPKKQTLSELLHILNKLSMIITLFILIFVILNNFLNLMLDESQIRQWNFQYGKHQKRYLQIFIIYIFLTGIVLLCFNTLKIKGFLFAYVPFFLSLVYALFLIFYRPYKYTLFIHQISIIFNESIIILSFGIISLKNLFPSLSQYYFLIYSYVNLSLCAICLVISIIRFIYECKYGDQILQKQRKNEEEQKLREINKKKKKQKRKVQKLKSSKQVQLNARNQNKYLMQNQLLEEEQINFLNWLKSKPYLSKYQRDLLYFQKYKDKPIKWLKIHQKQEYKIYQQREENKKQISSANVKIKVKSTLQNQQLQIIKADLRKSLKYKRFKHQRTSPNSNLNSHPNSKQKFWMNSQQQHTIEKYNKDSNDIIRPLMVEKNNNNSLSKNKQKTPEKKHQLKVQVQNKKKLQQSTTKKDKAQTNKKY